MKRRNFLQTLLGLAGTTALPANSNIRGQQQIEALKLLETSIAAPLKTNMINVRWRSTGTIICLGIFLKCLT